MRAELASDVQDHHHDRGPALGTDRSPTLAPVGAGGVPELSAALELRQIAGIHAGGTYPLAVGSYRFGHRSSPSALAAGEPTTPRFGLTIDPAGCVTLIPPPGASGSMASRSCRRPALPSVR